MSLIILIILRIFTVILSFTRSDPVDGRPFGRLEFVPEFGAPADDFCDGIAKGHVPEGDGGVLGCGDSDQSGEGEVFEAHHFKIVVEDDARWSLDMIDLWEERSETEIV